MMKSTWTWQGHHCHHMHEHGMLMASQAQTVLASAMLTASPGLMPLFRSRLATNLISFSS